jgi:hypothetical protein
MFGLSVTKRRDGKLPVGLPHTRGPGRIHGMEARGALRHACCAGLRDDKEATAIVRAYWRLE